MNRYRTSCPLLAVFLLLLLVTTAASAQTDKPTRIAVLDLQFGGKLDSEYQLPLSDALRFELIRTGRFQVMERNQMESVLVEQGFQMAGCASDECAIKAGKLLGVQQMMAGSISKVGDLYSIILRLIDVESGAIVDADKIDCACPIEEVLSVRLRQAANHFAHLPDDTGVSASYLPMPVNTDAKGDLYIKSSPSKALVFLNGEEQDGVTPLFLEKLPAGTYALKVTKDNLACEQAILVVADSTIKLDVTLSPAKAALRVLSEPFEANVFLDEKFMGKTPLVLNSVDAGKHHLRVNAEGYNTYSSEIFIDPAQENRISVNLCSDATLLEISANAKTGRIIIDGTPRTVVFPATLTITPGKHVVRVRVPYYEVWQSDVTITEGEKNALNVELVKSKSSFTPTAKFLSTLVVMGLLVVLISSS